MCIAIIRAKYRGNTKHDFDAADEADLARKMEDLGANEQCIEVRVFRTEGKFVRHSQMVFKSDSETSSEVAP